MYKTKGGGITDKERETVISELNMLKERLEKLSQVFNMTADEDEIESVIYEEKAVMLRYSLALKRAKELGMTAFNGKEK